jgi:hypothetical protein
MDKIVNSILTAAIAVLKGPLFVLLLVSIVVSLVRHPTRRLVPARPRRPLPPQ